MDIIDEFIIRYRKEFDFYEHAARLSTQLLDKTLQDAGIRAIVTSRAKGFTRLEEKVRQRNQKNPYHSIESIFHDIVDLAGVRVALYFPGERENKSVIPLSAFSNSKALQSTFQKICTNPRIKSDFQDIGPLITGCICGT